MHLASEVFGLSAVESGLYEKPDNCRMAHFLKAPVCTVYAAANYPEPAALDLPRQLVVLRVERLLVKSAKLFKSLPVHKHEHTRGKRAVKTRETLDQVVAVIQKVVHPASIPTPYVGCDAMKRFCFDQIDGAAQQRGFCNFYICINEKQVAGGSAPSSIVPSNRWKAALYDRYRQAVAELVCNLNRAIRGTRIS
jgi:hypothetical protein